MQVVKAPLERELEKHFAKEIKRLGLMTLKLQIMGRRGWPDRLVVHNGVVYLAELKTETGELSPLQESTFAKLKARGVSVVILRTKTGITKYLEYISVQ
jgi:hypothetical protein